jgi:hypothetical protein
MSISKRSGLGGRWYQREGGKDGEMVWEGEYSANTAYVSEK